MTPNRFAVARSVRLVLSVVVAATALVVSGGCQNRMHDGKINWVEPEQAERAMLQRRGIGSARGEPLWLDPRTPEEFAKGRIPGAVNIPFRELETMYPTIRDRGTIIVYGAGFTDTIAGAASKRLLELRHGNVLTLRGGLDAWERAGNPVDRTAPGTAPGTGSSATSGAANRG